MIGCVLCVGGVNAASAMDADGQDSSAMQRSLDNNASSHEGAGASSGGDALGLSREAPVSSGSSSSSSSDSCPGPNPVSPARSNRRATLGWQSLLPGSIQ
ncbi:hypothetical protein P5Y53_09555 [Dyella jiangningensis]|uniref:hypothetical protein n=1 Tax=Dyella jiangningensis TaxID=1379159 RepID=UPI00240F9764|nr:hypothetical protein [Dyella jiangningensis]MDG2537907.1 hypothetical protein [Dyella jiangningensis]